MKETIFTASPTKEIAKVYPEYAEFYSRFKRVVEHYHNHKSLDLPDIWTRDFLPFQNRVTCKLYTFFYEPTYQSKKLSLDVRRVVKKYFQNSKQAPLRLDGGNLIINSKGIAFAFKKYGMPLNKAERNIKAVLNIKDITFLPREIGDKICHIDGFMQFLGDDTLLMNDNVYDDCLKTHMEKCIRIISSKHPEIKIVKMPIKWNNVVRYGIPSATGVYVNFLETSKAVFVPQYNLPEDKKAMDLVQSLTSKAVIGVDCEAISKHGGSIHCLTSVLMQ